MYDPLPLAKLENRLEVYSQPFPLPDSWKLPDAEVKRIIQSAIYYARRCQILEGELAKTRADIREIVSDATTIRVQASLPENPFPIDPSEV